MTLDDRRFQTGLFAVLALVMLATRTHSFSNLFHVPDTSWASFALAGYYLRSRFAFPALFALAFAIDVVMIYLLGTSGFCFTIAYWMLLPAYGTMWLAGRWARRNLPDTPAALPMLALALLGAGLVAHFFSSGGFYWLSGRFEEPTIAEFAQRVARYLPGTLASLAIWAGFAATLHALVKTKNRTAPPEALR